MPMAIESARRLSWPAQCLLLAIIVAGVWFRFDGLGSKAVWYDEVATFLHLSGKTQAELDDLYDGRALRAGELLADYQGGTRPPIAGAATASPASIAAVVKAVAADEPQSGALYFAVANTVDSHTGDPARVRALSAVASTVSLLLLGMLAGRLFGTDAAWVAVALAAVSPLEIRFAHEARPYALGATLLLASALAAIRARQARVPAAWILYSLCLTAALWTHPIALLAVPGLLALAITSATDRDPLIARRTSRAGGLATAFALLAWLPWAIVCGSALPKIQRLTAWSSEPIGIDVLARGWLGAMTSLFFRPRGEGGLFPADFNGPASSVAAIALAIAAFAIATMALVSIARHPDRPTRHYVLLLVLLPWLAFATWDIAFGGRRSTVPRYLLPAWVGLQLAVAYWVTRSGSWRRFRDGLVALCLALGLATAWQMQSARGWWDTDVPRLVGLQDTATAINAISGAIVVTDAPALDLLELARHLHPQTYLWLGEAAATTISRDEWSRTVLAAPSPRLFDAMSRQATSHGETLVKLPAGDSAPALWRAAKH